MTEFTAEAFDAIQQCYRDAAAMLPVGKIRSSVLTRADEIRPWVRLAKRHPLQTRLVLEHVYPSSNYLRTALEGVCDMPNRAQRILRGLVLTLATGDDHLRSAPTLVLRQLAVMGEATLADLNAATKPPYSEGQSMCASDFNVSVDTLRAVGIVEGGHYSGAARISDTPLSKTICEALGIEVRQREALAA